MNQICGTPVDRTMHGPPCTRIAVKVLLFALASTLFQPIFAADAVSYSPDPAPVRRSELINLVRQDCGSCHGLTLKGGLGPALLPETLGDKPVESLKATILQGRPGTPMPPWKPFLTETEAEWIVHQLQKGFPSAR
ncbi:MAG TPA: cytochrome c [Noviherbaspirillum sp.]|uniref:c-type cytochrome n=1 Tax=Noviherbaspirillum sp. TaxID=1926288 RepID=UPI002B47FD44|nr:cytochrome c [Noviherbaspirillum sp.]HJV84288.1 cytochrome c [Noviherbaspirillum sp.]